MTLFKLTLKTDCSARSFSSYFGCGAVWCAKNVNDFGCRLCQGCFPEVTTHFLARSLLCLRSAAHFFGRCLCGSVWVRWVWAVRSKKGSPRDAAQPKTPEVPDRVVAYPVDSLSWRLYIWMWLCRVSSCLGGEDRPPPRCIVEVPIVLLSPSFAHHRN